MNNINQAVQNCVIFSEEYIIVRFHTFLLQEINLWVCGKIFLRENEFLLTFLQEGTFHITI